MLDISCFGTELNLITLRSRSFAGQGQRFIKHYRDLAQSNVLCILVLVDYECQHPTEEAVFWGG